MDRILLTPLPFRATALLVTCMMLLSFMACGSSASERELKLELTESEGSKPVSLGPESAGASSGLSTPERAGPRTSSELRNLRAVLTASTVFLGSLAILFEIESDRAYSRYQDTANPVVIQAHFDEAEYKRDLSTTALVVAEASLVLLVISYLAQEREKEPKPGSVIIGLDMTPNSAGVEIRW